MENKYYDLQMDHVFKNIPASTRKLYPDFHYSRQWYRFTTCQCRIPASLRRWCRKRSWGHHRQRNRHNRVLTV